MPASITMAAAVFRSVKVATIAATVISVTSAPPASTLSDPVSVCTSSGPSAAISPARAQTANTTGAAASIGPRVAGGSDTSGTSERSAPGAGHRLAQQQHADGLHCEHAEQHQVDQPGRRGQVLHREGGQQHAGACAHARGERVGERAAFPVDVEHACADRAEGRARRDPLDDAGRDEVADAAGGGEHYQRKRLDRDGGKQHRPAPDVIRQPSEDEQRDEHGDRVDPEDDRRRDRGESPVLLVDGVQRGRRARGGEHRHRQRREQQQRGRAGQRQPRQVAGRARRASGSSGRSRPVTARLAADPPSRRPSVRPSYCAEFMTVPRSHLFR